MKGDIFYRYEGYEYLIAEEYISIRQTPGNGEWIIRKQDKPYLDHLYDLKERNNIEGIDQEIKEYTKIYVRLIFPNSARTFAWKTKQEARISYIKRKVKQIGYLQSQLNNAYMGLIHAENNLFDDSASFEWDRKGEPIVEKIKKGVSSFNDGYFELG